MNEMSNGAHPRRALHVRTGFAVALLGGFAVTLAACPGPTPQIGTGGSGGQGSSTSLTSSTSAASSSSGGTPCTMPGECPAPENVCKTAICEGNTCGVADAAAKTPCTDGGMFCDGAGSCVACTADVHCQTNINPNPCNGSIYTAPPKCNSGACELAQPQPLRSEAIKCFRRKVTSSSSS